MHLGLNQETSSSQDTSTEMTREFLTNLKLDDEEKERGNHESKEEFREEGEEAVEEEEDDDDTEEEEEEDVEFSFSLAFDGANSSPITAEDAFSNGQIKPIFPLFNQDILLQEGVVMENSIANDQLYNVKKVFVEAGSLPPTASTSGNGDAAGTYCYWEKKEVVVAPKACKKSNSTGFSKIWRFRDLMHRSSSDGRDTFVFMNSNNKTTSSGITRSSGKKTERTARKADKKKKAVAESTVNGDEVKVKVAGEKGKAKAKKVVKGKTAVSAHEVYLRSKAREHDRLRPYLPYRPEKVGFFTNITGGGLTKNVHPF